MRLLVIGGSGFIGQHVAQRALAQGWEVTSLSRRPDARHPDGVRPICADVSDGGAMTDALRGRRFDHVVNAGGYVDHATFSRGGRAAVDAHFAGTMHLVESLDRTDLQAFVNIGSSDEYGASPAPQHESAREAPISPYSFGKTAAAHFLQMLHRTESFPATTLRLFLTYGPRQGDERFLPQVIRGCLENRSFPVSEGGQLRDFCYIDDVVAGVFATLTHPAARGEVVNVASGQPVTIRSVIETVRRLVGQGDPQFGAYPYRPSENMALYADVSRAERLLGWRPAIALEDGLARTIAAVQGQS